MRLLRGQGLSDADLVGLVARVDGLKPSQDRWDTSHLRSSPMRATADPSHKHQAYNTLICAPEQTDEDHFRLGLSFDQDCELMRDHQTGQHVQGMVLIEAARQAFLAVTEQFCLPEGHEKTYFVINDMITSFVGFMFPLGAHIDYRVTSKDLNERRQKFSVEMDFIQNDDVKMTAAFSFTVYPDQLISQNEADLARDAAETFFARTSASAQSTRPCASPDPASPTPTPPVRTGSSTSLCFG